MLSGHNRANVVRLAGLTEMSAIVKEGLSEQYDKTCSQEKRNDIICELETIFGN